MRFGSQLHTRVVPEWANAYIDYDRFKSKLKLEASHAQSKLNPNLVPQSALILDQGPLSIKSSVQLWLKLKVSTFFSYPS